jgi:hypothetical protein
MIYLFYYQGPLYSGDMMGRERLDRPIITTFQRHPGTNLPEAQEIVRVSTSSNISQYFIIDCSYFGDLFIQYQ